LRLLVALSTLLSDWPAGAMSECLSGEAFSTRPAGATFASSSFVAIFDDN
jgi:hypothetical protein